MQKIAYAFVCILFALFSCDKPANQTPVSPAEMKNVSFKENVALFDARVRAVDPQNFVRELVFADFSEKGVMGNVVNFENIVFTDDGQQFDTKAGDRVFTAIEKMPYNESVKVGSLTGSQPKSLLEAPVVDPAFKRLAELSAYQVDQAQYVVSSPNARLRPIDVLVCVIQWGNDCRAADNGWCTNCCIDIRCHHEIW